MSETTDPQPVPDADPECLFCKMVSGEIQADEVVRTERVLAFRDLNPVAPTHVLVIPTQHLQDVAAAGNAGGVLDEMARVAGDIAADECPDGWRWVFNSGPDAGQSVFHVHGHLLGGRDLAWPPG